ncbi:MAG: phosphomannomutase/phosphoglucomutase [Gammaproteobacteria bacterium]|nr:phosphomannomutase/phosphoglucomutase [Gammaproteobacteria bacterium]MYD80485.1 phosphomannomutase/phosphoglucomutase [Gammaproteobacteria bacterium]
MNGTTTLRVPRHIFRQYDIRGRVADELTEEVTARVGQAFANECVSQRTNTVLVAGDVRLSTESLRNALTNGLRLGGANVLDLGVAPTPLLYFATEHFQHSAGIVITGSHNPPEFNGLKFVLNYIPFAGEDLQALYETINTNSLTTDSGTRASADVIEPYIKRVLEDVKVHRPIRLGIDCGNGVTGVLGPRLFEEIGCEVHAVHSTPDGTFPNHHPDPVKPENLRDLIKLVRSRDLDVGIAFDGDGDRLGVVTRKGEIVSADILMSYFAYDILQEHPGADFIFDVKCGSTLPTTITSLGGCPVMWKTGHTNIKQKIRELEAPLGGEFSGHICFADRWYGFDDALYSAARLVELISQDTQELDDFLQSIPERFSTPEIEVPTTDERKFAIIDELRKRGSFGRGRVLTVDGLRVDYEDSWGLIRASNTTANLTMRFEATSGAALKRVKNTFLSQLKRVAPDLIH